MQTLDNQIQIWAAALGWPTEACLQLLLAAIAGGLIGLEREVRGRQAGFRTNMLVCMGSTLVMIVSTQFAHRIWNHSANFNVTVDPARIAYGVMSGVGFLGAGTIIHNRGSVRGLTTAAALWCVAAVGLSIGFGLYLLSMIAVVLILASLWLLDYVESVLPSAQLRLITIRTKYHAGCIAEAMSLVEKMGFKVIDMYFERDTGNADIHLRVSFHSKSDYYSLERRMAENQNFELIAARE